MNWIPHPTVLQGSRFSLLPLEKEHFDALIIAAADERIFEFMSVNLSHKETLIPHLQSLMLKRLTGECYPFTVIDNAKQQAIGSTVFHNMMEVNKKLEIGWTWYSPQYWQTGCNRECKFLLLRFCFETLKTVRVQLITDVNNHRSRRAIEGIGATFEGVLRNERIRSNGRLRDTAVYSIIEQEWAEVKEAKFRQLAESLLYVQPAKSYR
ncbi:MAG: N-acetyltransferase [Chitinophagia bacterium]|nr:N-acetyltransferase [Chitinophagia bacterium]